jgi:hypothetical protein
MDFPKLFLNFLFFIRVGEIFSFQIFPNENEVKDLEVKTEYDELVTCPVFFFALYKRGYCRHYQIV